MAQGIRAFQQGASAQLPIQYKYDLLMGVGMAEAKYAFAHFLRAKRLEKGFSTPGQLALALRQAGRRVSVQAVQQWENTDPDNRTTRPNEDNRRTLAEILGCEYEEVEAPYLMAKQATKTEAREKFVSPRATEPRTRIVRSFTSSGFLSQARRQLMHVVASDVPGAMHCIEREISPFGIKRVFDYLSPRAAVEMIPVGMVSPFVFRGATEAILWRLVWLYKLDKDVGMRRRYCAIFYVPDAPIREDDMEAKENEARRQKAVTAAVERMQAESAIFEGFLEASAASDPQTVVRTIRALEGK